nr:epididymal sperm-binding protein 1-like [Pogona vitticeps]
MSNKKPWCSLTNNYDIDLQWTYCEPSDPDPKVSAEEDPNIQNLSCVFPFIYKGTSHSACTSEGRIDGKLWCATSHNYDVDKKWVYCNVTGELDVDPRERCVFPFVYNLEFYFSCTTDGMSGVKPWCSLTTNYNADLQWTYCESIGPDEAVESPPCIFPFIFEGRIYRNCTTDGQNNRTLWCATTSNYDAHKKWKFCQDYAETPDPDPKEDHPFCVFPFIYKGNTYNACTTEGMSDGKLWCANTSNYDVDKQWVYCNATDADPKSLCVFPFIYNQKLYLSCTTDGMFGRTPWCSLTQNYNKDLRWTYCEPTGPGEIRERPPCIFPFTYKGKEYSNCTGDGRRDRRPWCATTDSYDMDSKGKFCQVSGSGAIVQVPPPGIMPLLLVLP